MILIGILIGFILGFPIGFIKWKGLKSDQSEYNSEYNKKKLTDMVDKTWVNSSDITWITTAADKRNKKIDEILN